MRPRGDFVRAWWDGNQQYMMMDCPLRFLPMKPTNRPRLSAIYISMFALLAGPVSASGTITLGDYEQALRSNNLQQIQSIRSYMLGAVETHLMYSKKLSHWTSFDALCTGDEPLNRRQLGALIEIEISSLRRRYGEDILGMPIVEAIPGIVEQHYRCF
jgi:hypothetical protein